MKKIMSLIIIMTVTVQCKVLEDYSTKPTSLETITAVKELMNSSAFRAIKTLKQVSDEGAIGVLPENIGNILKTLSTLGYGDEIDEVTRQIQAASGIVASEGTAIMSESIREVDLGDAAAIILGGKNAATQVLRESMYTTVKRRYSLKIEDQLAGQEAMKYWPIAINAYNLFAENDIEDSLPDFIAERAVDALFLTMGAEEAEIRNDPASIGKAVVTKVFDYYRTRS